MSAERMDFDMWQDFARKNSPNHHVVQTILPQIVHGQRTGRSPFFILVLVALYQIIIGTDKDGPKIFVRGDVVQKL